MDLLFWLPGSPFLDKFLLGDQPRANRFGGAMGVFTAPIFRVRLNQKPTNALARSYQRTYALGFVGIISCFGIFKGVGSQSKAQKPIPGGRE